MKDGVRVLNVARGELLVEEDLRPRSTPGRSRGAALDVFRSEPMTEHPLFGRPNVIVTPHLGASTTEAQDRAGVQTAEQVVAALTGGVVTTAVNVARARRPRTSRCSGPSCRCAATSGRSAWRWPPPRRSTASRSSCSAGSPSATPACSSPRCCSACSRATPRRRSTRSTPRRSPRSAGSRSSRPSEHERPRLHRPRARHGHQRRRARPRRRHEPRAPEPPAPARGLGPPLQPPARAALIALFRYDDVPGMIGARRRRASARPG